MQSLSVEQVVLHIVPLHLKLPQAVWVGVAHVPAPLQKAGDVAVEPDGPSLHAGARHSVEFGQTAQPLPSCLQLPSWPQVDVA
jgi:hypothetical protein